MNRKRILIGLLAVLPVVIGAAWYWVTDKGFSFVAEPASLVSESELARSLAVIRSQPGEESFDSIPWMTSLWEARIRAAKEGKPILLWEGNGHPLGVTNADVIFDRATVFADPDISRLARDSFITVACDDWYERRRNDDAGRFFARVANQGPRKGEKSTNRQGIYCLTADGGLLSFQFFGRDTATIRRQLQTSLEKFQALPANQRTPGGVTIEPRGQDDPQFTRIPPNDDTIIRVTGRFLERRGDGLARVPNALPSRDHLWLLAHDLKLLAPPRQTVGFTYPVPRRIAERIARYHLIDATGGEPGFWQRNELRKNTLALTVLAVSGETIELALKGEIVNSEMADLSLSKHGFECSVNGRLDFNMTKKTFTRFDAFAIGTYWGGTTNAEKSARATLGVAFELANGNRPGDVVPPQGVRDVTKYFGNE